MTSHEEFESRLLDVGFGSLSDRKKTETLEHAAECGECGEWLETYGWLEDALAPSEAEHPSGELLARYALLGEGSSHLAQHVESCFDCGREVELSRAAVSLEAERVPDRWVSARVAMAAALVAAAILVPLWLRSSPSPEAQAVQADPTEESVAELTANQPIGAGETAVLKARSVVALAEGFSVGDGASLTIAVGEGSSARLDRPTRRTGT